MKSASPETTSGRYWGKSGSYFIIIAFAISNAWKKHNPINLKNMAKIHMYLQMFGTAFIGTKYRIIDGLSAGCIFLKVSEILGQSPIRGDSSPFYYSFRIFR